MQELLNELGLKHCLAGSGSTITRKELGERIARLIKDGKESAEKIASEITNQEDAIKIDDLIAYFRRSICHQMVPDKDNPEARSSESCEGTAAENF